MRASTHIAGGIFFTGTLASFFNCNIFANWQSLVFTIFFALLPDIDLRKSTLGIIFYPISTFLERRFGHRTLTHSLIFLLSLSLFMYVLAINFHFSKHFVLIAFFSCQSHLILDMITVQGIPLFYPSKYPCVIPANPSFRLQTSNYKNDAVLTGVFLLLCITFYPLFENGFWSAYNRGFATISHVDRENKGSKNWVKCEYSYTKNGQKLSGNAYVIESEKENLILFDTKIHQLESSNNSTVIHSTKPIKTEQPKQQTEINFYDISPDSINKILSKKIVTGVIQCNTKFKYSQNNVVYTSNLLKPKNEYNLIVYVDSNSDSLKQSIIQRIEILEIQLSKEKKELQTKNSVYDTLVKRKATLLQRISETKDFYTQNKLQKEYQETSEKLANFTQLRYEPDEIKLTEIKNLKAKLNSKTDTRFNGFVSYPTF